MSEVTLGMAIARMRGLIPSAAMDVVRDQVLPQVLERLVALEDQVESLQQQLTSEIVSEPAGDE